MQDQCCEEHAIDIQVDEEKVQKFCEQLCKMRPWELEIAFASIEFTGLLQINAVLGASLLLQMRNITNKDKH